MPPSPPRPDYPSASQAFCPTDGPRRRSRQIDFNQTSTADTTSTIHEVSKTANFVFITLTYVNQFFMIFDGLTPQKIICKKAVV